MSKPAAPEAPYTPLRNRGKQPTVAKHTASPTVAPACPEQAPAAATAAVLIAWNGEFFAKVRERNTHPDGTVKDPTLPRRLSHDICRACHEQYREKFPGQPFQIVCEGIYSEPDFHEIAQAAEMTYEEVREALDIPYWAERRIKLPNKEGDMAPFVARDYQKEDLWCTAKRKVKRWGRGLGKTSCQVAKEIHTSVHRKRYNTLIALPMKAQAQKWFDEIKQACMGDEDLASALVGTRQQPYFTFRFDNKTTINLFTAGSKSGSNADSLRAQSPRRVGVDEQDLLNDADWKAIMPLLRRFKDSEFEGSSTPLGKREKFWEMCTQYPDYKETHFPINRHPDFSPEYEAAARREARTEINYTHEFLAEFGDLEGGVFKNNFIDDARAHYLYTQERRKAGKIYALGVDWNGQGTGSRMRVVEYDPETKKRRMVDHSAVNTSTADTLAEIRKLNREWQCTHIYIDQGFGYVQDELLKSIGAQASNADDRRLKDVQTVDFGATLKTNKLVPNRENNPYKQKEELERPTKPFLVEGMMMALEGGLFEFSDDDKLLEEQMRAYKVKTYTKHGWANAYTSDKGDHDLDATMLAMLAIEINYGITSHKQELHRALVRHTPAFGASDGAPVNYNDPATWQFPQYKSTKEVTQQKGSVPSREGARTSPYTTVSQPQAGGRDLYGNQRSFIQYSSVTRPTGKAPVPSRTPASAGSRGRLLPPKGFRR